VRRPLAYSPRPVTFPGPRNVASITATFKYAGGNIIGRCRLMAKLDEIDTVILQELVKDSSQSIPKLSRKIDVNTSVVYSRIKRLIRRGIIKRFTVEVDESQLGYSVSAYVGVNVDSKRRDSVRAGLMGIADVREIAEVTGRFDFLVLVRARGLEELHNTVSQGIGMLDGVEHTETFISMRQESKFPEIRLGQ